MSKFIFFLICFFSISAQAFTLNNNFGARFKSGDIKTVYASNTLCTNLTYYDMEDIIREAAGQFWNQVPTSSLSMKLENSSTAVPNINLGILCSPTDAKCITDAGLNIIPVVDDIVIGCNSENANFGGSNVLAVTIPNNFSGNNIKGAVILVNNASQFKTMSREDQIGVIAHEIGHALGLGHSPDKASLMYYRTTGQRTHLGQDDIDGSTYLYPMQVDGFGLLGGCATITTGSGDSNPPGNPPLATMGITLGLMILLFELFKRAKTRSAL